jgi:aspartate/methionine/tyrosine aminotransferase
MNFSAISKEKGYEFAVRPAKEVGVATVPGFSFYSPTDLGKSVTRFAFSKRLETLEKAAERLAALHRQCAPTLPSS